MPVQRTCLECGKPFSVPPSLVRRGGGKFCSTSCGIRYRNKIDNPAKRPEVREKISRNHADVSGPNNPMYGRRGPLAPAWKDGRSRFSNLWRMIALSNKPPVCEMCGERPTGYRLHVHHRDGNRNNNSPDNLQVLCARRHAIVHGHWRNRPRDHLGRFVRAS